MLKRVLGELLGGLGAALFVAAGLLFAVALGAT